jgi:delta-aminolevulinic acid dehydratase/porphobilinogen synthase
MTRQDVEKVRKRAARSLCTYEVSGAYVRIRAAELMEVCEELLQRMRSSQMEMDL